MAEFRPVGRVQVSLWGHKVGVLVPSPERGYCAFKFDRSFLDTGIQIAPLMMPRAAAPYQFTDLPRNAYEGLPPCFADSLPDGFGNLLIRRWARERQYDVDELPALDKLCYVGNRAMGALCYEPMRGPGGRPTSLDMRGLVEQSRAVLNGDLAKLDEPDALREIIRIGSSAGGAQPKAIVGWNRTTGAFMMGDRDVPDGFEQWIVKFTPREFPWRGEREYAAYLKARDAGVEVSESRLYELDGLKHFMTKRFDREGNRRHHVQTLSAMAHFPMSVPLAARTYEQLLATVDALQLGYEAMEEAFRRICFNVYLNECDDHTKNFSFLLKEGGAWQLAPAYDLTGSGFPSEDPWSAHGDRHQLSVNGKFREITDDDLFAVADRFGIGTGPRVLKQVKEASK